MTRQAPSAGEDNKTQGRPTIHHIQLLRAVAALLVVFFHAHQAFALRFTGAASQTERHVFAFGAVGVHMFFVISGFIMVYTIRTEKSFNATAFYKRRLLRIYPIYWLCIGLYLIVHALLGEPYSIRPQELLGALTLWPGDAAQVIGPAWTLSFEMFFYLCFGVAMIAGLERGLLLLGGTFACAILAGVIFRLDSTLWWTMTNSLLMEFVAGTAIGWAFLKGKLPQTGGRLLIVGAVSLYTAGIAIGYDRLPSVIMWGAPSALLVLGLVMHEKNVGAGPRTRQLSRLGDSSYALYLIHILIITLALRFVASMLPQGLVPEPAIAAIMVAIAALAAGEFLHRAIERPALARLNPKRALVPVRG